MISKHVFVSESVTRGHPDKLCDQISDALVDAYLHDDPRARIDAECAIANGIVFIGTHYRTDVSVDVAATAREVIAAAGYADGEFNHRDCTVLTSLKGVTSLAPRPPLDPEPSESAFDDCVSQHQATVFGYACKQTPEFMPLPILLAHKLARELDTVRETGRLSYLLPDAKTQVAVEYGNRAPSRIHSIALDVSADPDAATSHSAFVNDLRTTVVEPVLRDRSPGIDADTRVLINHEGVIRTGGPALHSGLTGRKTAVDTYGEFARHSGAALSGKDPLRTDRLGAYAARHAAKNVVAAGLADECEVQLSYTIGVARPVGFHVETFGTNRVAPDTINDQVLEHFELRPLGMLLAYAFPRAFRFRDLAVYGHVGREDLDLPWERLDKVEQLSQVLQK